MMTSRTPLREAAYDAIDGERDYQDQRRGNSARDQKNDNRDLGSLIILLTEEYLAKVRTAFSGPHPAGKWQVLDQLRKVAALSVLAMELHGVVLRNDRIVAQQQAVTRHHDEPPMDHPV